MHVKKYLQPDIEEEHSINTYTVPEDDANADLDTPAVEESEECSHSKDKLSSNVTRPVRERKIPKKFDDFVLNY